MNKEQASKMMHRVIAVQLEKVSIDPLQFGSILTQKPALMAT